MDVLKPFSVKITFEESLFFDKWYSIQWIFSIDSTTVHPSYKQLICMKLFPQEMLTKKLILYL